MKKRYVIIGLLAASLTARGQRNDTSYVRKIVSRTDVQWMFAFYTQDNDHSAVTGGTGTEKLKVYGGELSIGHQRDSAFVFQFNGGVDIISSASTNNISTLSSASKIDARSHFNFGYGRIFRSGIVARMNTGLSFESDYWSRNVGMAVSRMSRDQSRDVSLSLQTFFDDLRWGRLSSGRPKRLIYPQELRDTTWYDEHSRKSFNLEGGLTQVINRKLVVGIYPGLVYQSGLLATPFHRVFFSDSTMRVENFPSRRWKFPVGIQLNSFLGNRVIMRLAYRFYNDDFGIKAHNASIELPVKISSRLTLTPLFRYYYQTASRFFRPYLEHDVTESFYTSDYDLSEFRSYKPGLAVRIGHLEVRYALYKRSDGLEAHMFTLYINTSSVKEGTRALGY